eukprot:maker-scaffold290_size220039-snap-gene-1.13 protein:Tk02626 transcript:maker-scaffold290_size220039-snap-gene-1.13-mRNA-1 annotation:"rna-directed dna polymerase from mobile element jockey-like"
MLAVTADLTYLEHILNERALGFAEYATRNGLVLNPAKTQLMIGMKVKSKDLTTLISKVAGTELLLAKEMELLGVRKRLDVSTFVNHGYRRPVVDAHGNCSKIEREFVWLSPSLILTEVSNFIVEVGQSTDRQRNSATPGRTMTPEVIEAVMIFVVEDKR